MKFLFAVLFFTVLVLNVFGKTKEEVTAAVKKYVEECQADPATYAPEEQLQKLAHNEDVDLSIVGPYIVCMSKKMHIMNDDGTPNPEGIKNVLKYMLGDDTKIDEIVKECAHKENTDAETALKMGKCLAKHRPRHQ